MNFLYKNNTKNTVIFQNLICLPGDELSVPFPIPSSLGLTCIQEGSSPDPVLFHDDIIIPPQQTVSVSLSEPLLSHNVALRILDMSLDSGVECRFNSTINRPIPIDARGFVHVLPWQFCSKIFFFNNLDILASISITAIEVIQ